MSRELHEKVEKLEDDLARKIDRPGFGAIASIIVAIFLHGGVIIYAAGSLTQEVKGLVGDRYTGTEAKKDRESINLRFNWVDQRIKKLEEK